VRILHEIRPSRSGTRPPWSAWSPRQRHPSRAIAAPGDLSGLQQVEESSAADGIAPPRHREFAVERSLVG